MSICEYANMAREKKKTEETIIKRSPAERERESPDFDEFL
jgi:hypothetical protein